jgi:peroxiredoxin
MKTGSFFPLCVCVIISIGVLNSVAFGSSDAADGSVALRDEQRKMRLKVGDRAPDFSLPSSSGEVISLSDYADRNNVVLSFVPAAWTPVCSQQWPGYNLAEDYFEQNNAVLLGITVDNTPTQSAWIEELGGLCFSVLSDFWPHGAVCESYGVLRPDGVAERALFIIDAAGIIRYIDIHDIEEQPDLGLLIQELEKINSQKE